jgi:hypothetical protein
MLEYTADGAFSRPVRGKPSRKSAMPEIFKPIALPLVFGLMWSGAALSQDITKLNTIETHAAATIDAIKISNQKFAFRKYALQKYGGLEWPIISFNISNKGRKTIQRLYMRAYLKAPGRSVPFADQNIEYFIPGGIAPGESKHVDLDAAIVGDWSDVTKETARKASFFLTVTAVDDDSGNRLVK